MNEITRKKYDSSLEQMERILVLWYGALQDPTFKHLIPIVKSKTLL